MGQNLQRQSDGGYVGVEKHPLVKNHPERIPKILGHPPFGRWLAAPRQVAFKGMWSMDKTIIRVERYKDTEESTVIKEAVAYGSNTFNMQCWYDYAMFEC